MINSSEWRRCAVYLCRCSDKCRLEWRSVTGRRCLKKKLFRNDAQQVLEYCGSTDVGMNNLALVYRLREIYFLPLYNGRGHFNLYNPCIDSYVSNES